MKPLTLRRFIRRPKKRTHKARKLLQNAPKLIDGKTIELLWSFGGYDGTCSGIARTNIRGIEECVFYQNVVSIEAKRRLFAVVALTEEQYIQELLYHQRYTVLIDHSHDYVYVDGQRMYRRDDVCYDNERRARGFETLKSEFPDRRSIWSTDSASVRGGFMPLYVDNEVIGYFGG